MYSDTTFFNETKQQLGNSFTQQKEPIQPLIQQIKKSIVTKDYNNYTPIKDSFLNESSIIKDIESQPYQVNNPQLITLCGYAEPLTNFLRAHLNMANAPMSAFPSATASFVQQSNSSQPPPLLVTNAKRIFVNVVPRKAVIKNFHDDDPRLPNV